MADVFLSYKREDIESVVPIVRALENSGVSVWYDAKSRISVEFIEEINNELNAAKCVVVVWSKRSIGSRYVKSEAFHAFERDRLVPVRIDDVVVPVPFSGIQTADFRSWEGRADSEAWRALKRVVLDYSQDRIIAPRQNLVEVDDPLDVLDGDTFTEIVKYTVAILGEAAEPITSATLANVLRSKFPKSISPFNYAGHKKFGDLVGSMNEYGVLFNPTPPGLVELQHLKVSRKAHVEIDVVNELKRDQSKLSFVERLFEVSEAPLLDAKRYFAVFSGIADAIRGESKTITEITKRARDYVNLKSISVSRDKVSYIYKGALIGGLRVEDPFITPEIVGYTFAKAVYDECGGLGWTMSPEERDELLKLFGLRQQH